MDACRHFGADKGRESVRVVYARAEHIDRVRSYGRFDG